MSEQNVSDKLAEVITSIFKKTNMFEKIERIQGLITISTGFFIITSTLTLINYYFIKDIYSKNNEQTKLLKNINNNLSKITEDNNFINFKVYEEFQKKINIISDINIELQNQGNKILEKLEENIEKIYITTMTSTSDFEKYFNKKVEKEDAEVYENIDNELLQECYDSLPCNNVKKTTLSGFLYWK